MSVGKRLVEEQIAENEEQDAPLFVFTWDHEWVIARSPEDAWDVFIAHQGGLPEVFEDREGTEWVKCPPEDNFTFDDPDSGEATKTFAEWAIERGRGYFASEDY